jgi:probable phosphoglycerate mutase
MVHNQWAPTAVFTSDLVRARETAAIALRFAQKQRAATDSETEPLPALLVEPNLRERHCGHLQGLTPDAAAQTDPDGWQRFVARQPAYAPQGGESLAQLAQRVRAFLIALVTHYANGRVAVVTHGGVIDTFRRLVCATPFSRTRDFPIPNAGCFLLHVTALPAPLLETADELIAAAPCGTIRLWGETRHLENAQDELAVM